MDKEKALATLVLLSAMKPRKRKRSCWSKEWLKKRDEYSHMTLLKELKENNPNDFRNYLRMSDEIFRELHITIAPFIQKQDTKLRKAISNYYNILLKILKIYILLKICHISPSTGHTLSDNICWRVRNSNMMEDQNERSDMPDLICSTPHTGRYLSDLVCTDKIG